MRTAMGMIYIDGWTSDNKTSGEQIIPVSLDTATPAVVSRYSRRDISGSTRIWFTGKGFYIDREITSKILKKVKPLSASGWYQPADSDIHINLDAVDIQKTREYSISIRGSRIKIFFKNSDHMEFVFTHDYEKMMAMLKAPKPWYADSREEILKFLEGNLCDKVILSHDGINMAIPSSNYQNSPVTYKWQKGNSLKTIISTEKGKLCLSVTNKNWSLADMLRMWRKAGIKWTEETIRIRNVYYRAFVAPGHTLLEYMTKMADERWDREIELAMKKEAK